MPAKKKTTQKKQSAKQAKPKTKVVYRTRYVERPQKKSNNPFRETEEMVIGGAGLMIGASVLGGVSRSLNGMGK